MKIIRKATPDTINWSKNTAFAKRLVGLSNANTPLSRLRNEPAKIPIKAIFSLNKPFDILGEELKLREEFLTTLHTRKRFITIGPLNDDDSYACWLTQIMTALACNAEKVVALIPENFVIPMSIMKKIDIAVSMLKEYDSQLLDCRLKSKRDTNSASSLEAYQGDLSQAKLMFVSADDENLNQALRSFLANNDEESQKDLVVMLADYPHQDESLTNAFNCPAILDMIEYWFDFDHHHHSSAPSRIPLAASSSTIFNSTDSPSCIGFLLEVLSGLDSLATQRETFQKNIDALQRTNLFDLLEKSFRSAALTDLYFRKQTSLSNYDSLQNLIDEAKEALADYSGKKQKNLITSFIHSLQNLINKATKALARYSVKEQNNHSILTSLIQEIDEAIPIPRVNSNPQANKLIALRDKMIGFEYLLKRLESNPILQQIMDCERLMKQPRSIERDDSLLKKFKREAAIIAFKNDSLPLAQLDILVKDNYPNKLSFKNLTTEILRDRLVNLDQYDGIIEIGLDSAVGEILAQAFKETNIGRIEYQRIVGKCLDAALNKTANNKVLQKTIEEKGLTVVFAVDNGFALIAHRGKAPIKFLDNLRNNGFQGGNNVSAFNGSILSPKSETITIHQLVQEIRSAA